MIRKTLLFAMLGVLGVGTVQPALAYAPLHQASDPKNRVLDNNGHALICATMPSIESPACFSQASANGSKRDTPTGP
jgi:hypothetical protein